MHIQELLRTRELPREKPPPHELSACVNEIERVVGFTGKYGRGYWLFQVKRSGKAYPEMMGILKDIERMDAKYPKGATLTNKLKAWKRTS